MISADAGIVFFNISATRSDTVTLFPSYIGHCDRRGGERRERLRLHKWQTSPNA